MTKAYQAARIYDGVSGDIVRDGAVLVDEGRITSVQPAGNLPSDVDIVDLGDVTVLPGLIDAHVHLVWDASAEPHERVARESRALTVLRTAANAATHLRSGVTTVRDLGSTDGLALDVALAIEQGIAEGPRVIAAGRAIVMTGGHVWYVGREADGPDDVRRAVREQLKAGADCIKLMASGGGMGSAKERPGAPQLTTEELRVGVQEAHKAGREVTAHAHALEAINNALDAGVDSIEHGTYLDEETAIRMRESGTYLVPTLSPVVAIAERGPGIGVPAALHDKCLQLVDNLVEAFKTALACGVEVVAGSDGGVPAQPHGNVAEELELMVEAGGATPLQALRAATSSAAGLLGVAEEVGSLEPGKCADLIAVAGDPTTDIRALRNVRHVLRQGTESVLERE